MAAAKLILFVIAVCISNISVSAGMIINGSFEDPSLTVGSHYHLEQTAVLGWNVTGDPFDSLEIWSNPAVGFYANDGTQHLEILSGGDPSGGPPADSHGANVTITVFQNVTTEIGLGYSLTFYHTPRPGVYSTLEILANSIVLGTVAEDGSSFSSMNWKLASFSFTATSSVTAIGFRDTSSNYAGTHIDNVSLLTAAVPEPSSIVMWCIGAVGLMFARRNRRQPKLPA